MLRQKLIINIWLLHLVGFLSLHTLLTMHGHRNRKLELLFKMWALGVKVHNCNCLSNLYHKLQSSSGVHCTSYLLGTRVSFPEGKAADHSVPSSAKLRMSVAIHPLPSLLSWHAGTALFKLYESCGKFFSVNQLLVALPCERKVMSDTEICLMFIQCVLI